MQKELSRVHVQVAGVFYIVSIGDQLSLLLNQAIYCNGVTNLMSAGIFTQYTCFLSKQALL